MKNLAVILNYPLSNNVRLGNVDMLINEFKNALNVFDKVFVVSPRDNKNYSFGKDIEVLPNGFASPLLYYPSIIKDVITLVRLVRTQNVGVIRALAPTSGLAAVIAGKLTGVPVIVSVHTDQTVAATDEKKNALKNFFVNAVEPFVLRNATLVPVISGHIRDYALKRGARADKIVFHQNYVDTSKFKPAGQRKNNVLLFVGRLSKVKGAEEAIRAMPVILASHPRTVLKIAGTGEQENSLKELCARLGLEKSVLFLGRVDHEKQLPFLMADSTVFVAPRTAGFTLIEAMSSGMPIVAGNVEWSREVVRNGETGLLVRPSAEDVAKGVLKVLGSPVLARKMSANARKLAVETFSLSKWKKREIWFYKKFI